MAKHSKFVFGLVIVILILSLTGCAGGGGTTAGTQAPASSTSGAAPAAAAQTIRVLSMQQAGPTPEEMNAIVAEFNKANPNTKVEIEYVAYDALHDKIATALASKPPAYDVILVDDIWYAEFAKKGYVADVTSKITEDMRSKVFKAAWDITTVDNKVYGMPWLLDQKYFFYNAKLLSDAGFNAPPKTWEELATMGKAIQDKGIAEYPMVWSWSQAEAAVCDWVTLLYGNGGRMLDNSGKPAFNDQTGVDTLTWMVNSIDSKLTNPASISYVEEDVRNVFSQGKAVFASNWNYMYDLANNSDKESKVTGQVKVAPMPVFEKAAKAGINSSTINGSMGFSVVATSPNVDQAWEYVKYLTSENVQNHYSAHMLPIWESSFQGEAANKLMSSDTTKVMVPAFKDQFPTAHVRPKVAYYPEGSKALQLAMQQALTKQLSPKEALDQAAAKWTELQGK